jgi:serine phosphatase RsbU (regulator of sigma subunit)
VTLFLGILDTKSGHLAYASAGHPATILRRRAGGLQLLGRGSPPLGVFPRRSWIPGEIGLEDGDLLVLYTDGIIEARRDGEFFGDQRLCDLVESADVAVEQLPTQILDQVLEFSRGLLRDDVAVLVLSLVGGHARHPWESTSRQETLQV